LPVIATPVGGIPEFLEHGVNGLIIPVADVSKLVEAIGKVFEDRPFSENMALRAMETVRLKFGADAMVSQLKALYTEALASWSPEKI
jgi:glycosyltransferase involved in cell wall biosynthesis